MSTILCRWGRARAALLAAACGLLCAAPSGATVKPNALFSSGAVVQQQCCCHY